MIVWLNGASGAGKTTTAHELLDLLPGSTLYDPELLGPGLRSMLPPDRAADDVRELRSWRRLLADGAAALLTEVPGPLITPVSLLRQDHRDEIFGALAARRIPVCHVLLHCDGTTLRARAASRAPEAEQSGASSTRWPGQWAAYEAALPWLTADAHTVDTAGRTPADIAALVAEAVGKGAGLPGIVQTPEPSAETLAAGVLLFDEDDRVLLVDPTYKPGWEFPGGIVEHGEPPARAGMREVAEELGIELAAVPRLLLVDWEQPKPPGFGGLRLLFDGGLLPAPRAAEVLLPAAELRGWRFATESEAAGLLPPVRHRRLTWALRARERGTTLNLEGGVPVGV
ncbi:NUDIX domain-containing protein [Streptomyces sp. DSM 42041]|uniref:NUDIX domain-containing protein n=1 Tax=Streptomyces hazeniae TaxID=3075538 RepID=A0ABU2NYD1_9ACTN|nr:NUDIX domain-containing protein [Streptomyces sp. DSM 42041]MDT0381203.1 NUDIX domain-containing protein [Streptomyces sp. DSM 42041]